MTWENPTSLEKEQVSRSTLCSNKMMTFHSPGRSGGQEIVPPCSTKRLRLCRSKENFIVQQHRWTAKKTVVLGWLLRLTSLRWRTSITKGQRKGDEHTVHTYRASHKCGNASIRFKSHNLGKPNFILLIKVKKCTFQWVSKLCTVFWKFCGGGIGGLLQNFIRKAQSNDTSF